MLYNSIPVAMYHHTAPTDRELNIYPDLFEDQLRVLSGEGWKTLSGDEFLYFLENEKEKPRKCVLLTFDDGFADNYVYAYPVLKKFKMKAMIFIATAFIAEADIKRDSFSAFSHNAAWELAYSERRHEAMCTWKELEEMEKSGVFDVQSHGISHKTPDLIKAKRYKELKEDLAGGKSIIEKRLSKKICHFAWPRGHFDGTGIDIARDIGYKALYTVERGPNTSANLCMINRLPVKCKGGKWLNGKLRIYSSVIVSGLYLKLRTGI